MTAPAVDSATYAPGARCTWCGLPLGPFDVARRTGDGDGATFRHFNPEGCESAKRRRHAPEVAE
ncbi:hypothetical protein ACIQ7S_03710 [Streptomyces griseoluteus]|uniref:hypothetical protein n=1 Tax=Streptomyces griseoluteus TaxID=29306 RepID=UPI003330DBA5